MVFVADMRGVALRRVLQVGENRYDLETIGGERITLTYNGIVLTTIYSDQFENMSFSVEKRGLSGLVSFLDHAGFIISPACMITVDEELGDIPISGV